MVVEVTSSRPAAVDVNMGKKDKLQVKKKTLEAVLEQCQRALELLKEGGGIDEDDEDSSSLGCADTDSEAAGGGSSSSSDRDADEWCDLIRSKVEGPDFLKKLESSQLSNPQDMPDEGGSWDIVGKNDLWEAGNNDSAQDDYVLVHREDIAEGIACFMAEYLLTVKETKDLTPNQLQRALSKTFTTKKKKGKLQKAWDGSIVIYKVASWGATAIGMYQNPALRRVASEAFFASCRIISKFL